MRHLLRSIYSWALFRSLIYSYRPRTFSFPTHDKDTTRGSSAQAFTFPRPSLRASPHTPRSYLKFLRKRTIQTIRYHNAWRESYRLRISLVFPIGFSNGGLSSVDAIDKKKCSPRFARLRDISYQRDFFFLRRIALLYQLGFLCDFFWLILHFPSLGQAKCPSHHGATCNVRLLTPCPAYYLFSPLKIHIYNVNPYLVSNHSESFDLDGSSRSDESDAHTTRRIDRHLSIKTARIGA